MTVAGTMFGVTVQRQKRQRVDVLAAIETVLLDLEKRMRFSAVPIRDWLAEVAYMPQFSQLSFLKDTFSLLSNMDLETAWQQALTNSLGLAAEDIAALRFFGTHLGKSDTSTQLQSIRETLQRISVNKAAAAEKAEKAAKVCVGLGTCTGMAVALLLI